MALQFKFNPVSGDFDLVDIYTPGPGGGSYNVEKKTLTGADITNKTVTLSQTPTTLALTRLIVITGLEQDYGTDFTVSGTTLSWNGLGLESLLASGDKLVIVYN